MGSPEKNRAFVPKRQVCSSPGNGERLVSHRCPPPGVLPATQVCWDLGLFDQVDGRPDRRLDVDTDDCELTIIKFATSFGPS